MSLGSVDDAEWGTAVREGKHLLACNEPDHPGPANTGVEQALGLWPRLAGEPEVSARTHSCPSLPRLSAHPPTDRLPGPSGKAVSKAVYEEDDDPTTSRTGLRSS